MPRIRSVHPTLFTEEAFVSVSPLARVLWIGLWTDADDGGVFEWKPLQIKMRLLPGDHADVSELLDEMAEAGLIRGFTHNGKTYGVIKDFQKYQRPQKPRSTFPLPADLVPFATGQADPQPDLFADQSRTGTRISNQMEGRGEEDGIGGGGETRTRRKPETTLPEGFPDQEAVTWATERIDAEHVQVSVAREIAKFQDHHLAKGKTFKDWRAAWRTWINNAINWALEDGKVVRLEPRIDAKAIEKGQRYMMEAWLLDGSFPSDAPKPDEPGCPVPLNIMAEYGYTPGATVTIEMRRTASQRRRAQA